MATELDGIPPGERKRRLRTELDRRVARLSAQEAEAAAARMADLVLALPEMAHAGGVLACLSFGREPDTWGLVDRLLELDKAVYVPRVDRRERRLHLHRYPCALERLSFGLRQPVRGTAELAEAEVDEAIDVALIPGLAFDRRGYRLGHGAGHFDRFLAHRGFSAVGLAFHLQLLDELPVEAHDVPMAAVVTERGVWRPSALRAP